MITISNMKTSVRLYNMIREMISSLDDKKNMKTYRWVHSSLWSVISRYCLSHSVTMILGKIQKSKYSFTSWTNSTYCSTFYMGTSCRFYYVPLQSNDKKKRWRRSSRYIELRNLQPSIDCFKSLQYYTPIGFWQNLFCKCFRTCFILNNETEQCTLCIIFVFIYFTYRSCSTKYFQTKWLSVLWR